MSNDHEPMKPSAHPESTLRRLIYESQDNTTRLHQAAGRLGVLCDAVEYDSVAQGSEVSPTPESKGALDDLYRTQNSASQALSTIEAHIARLEELVG